MAKLVIASNSKAMPTLDRSVKAKVLSFFETLDADDAASVAHVESPHDAADHRVRTGRVDQDHMAILFHIDLHGESTYIYLGTWPQPDASRLAARSTLRINPINGALEGIIGELDGSSDRRKRVIVPDPRGELARSLSRTITTTAYLPGREITLEDLTERLGVDPAIAEMAMAAPNPDALRQIADYGLEWEKSALVELSVGASIDAVRTTHGFDENPIDHSKSEDEQILQALDQPASKMQFAYIEDDEELRRVIEEGDFAAWRTFLHPQQREYVERNYNGAFRLSGGAGTGKTVVAIHRARRLAMEDPNARVVLTTFNKTLALALEADLKSLDPSIRIAAALGEPGVHVRGIDALAREVLDQADEVSEAFQFVLGASFPPKTSRTRAEDAWNEAIDAAGRLDAKLATPGFLENEYVDVVLGNNITTVEAYTRVARPGRGVRLSRPQRVAVWKVVEAYRRQSRADGTISFPEVLAVSARYLQLRNDAGLPPIADHVVVDEAQDLHATHWRLLRALVPEGPNDLFLAEDSHQRIYGRPVVLGRHGIKIVGRSRRLTLNYRTTAQNLHFAVGILSGAEYTDLEEREESTTEYRSARRGPVPELVACTDLNDELDNIASRISDWLAEGFEPESLAVLTRSAQTRDLVIRGLKERAIEARAVSDNPRPTGHVQVLTMHRSKGMEFTNVVLAGLDDAHVPAIASIRSVPEEERSDALLRERSLLYVAASRARDQLVATWCGNLTDLVPTASQEAGRNE
ncbi:AAA family ATPase [Rhodococcus sp. HNM0563]|uniref:3'-5' exonuclease n=1 Tax=Rhodococcus sp. HNM0563 TaxID=2716339 RepID=UPI00146BB238|nr:3'-5' exonuclease [Rhodococcus sp. HNM0563]NLU64269.1 AAA family ATPase [Rhodococcus sp. HNM0563]